MICHKAVGIDFTVKLPFEVKKVFFVIGEIIVRTEDCLTGMASLNDMVLGIMT